MIHIGLDPDLQKSGVCFIDGKTIIELSVLPFFALIEKIKATAAEYPVMVVIEAGWLNKTKSYHAAINKSVAARIGANVGENHATGKLLEEAMIFYGIPYRTIKPTSAKWNADLFKKITGYTKRTNQEQRDALKLVWGL